MSPYTPMAELDRLCAMMPAEPEPPPQKRRRYNSAECPNHRWNAYTPWRYRCPECKATEKRFVVDEMGRAA
tara:strand:- start:1452 stop:1664 length:213 start_codon:yes stop_codon:yes gene_type:complete